MLVKMIFDHWAIFEKGHYHLIRWDETWSSFSLVPQMLQVLHSMHCRQWKCQCYPCLMLMRRKYLPRIMMHWRYHVPEYSTNNSFTLKGRKWSKMTKKYFLGKVLKLAKWTWWSEGKLGDRIVRTPSSLKTTLEPGLETFLIVHTYFTLTGCWIRAELPPIWYFFCSKRG